MRMQGLLLLYISKSGSSSYMLELKEKKVV